MSSPNGYLNYWSANLASSYDIIKKTRPHNYSYRFVICPENIGAVAFLHNNKKIKKY